MELQKSWRQRPPWSTREIAGLDGERWVVAEHCDNKLAELTSRAVVTAKSVQTLALGAWQPLFRKKHGLR
eukprot:923113-Amphidinium_carterae.1